MRYDRWTMAAGVSGESLHDGGLARLPALTLAARGYSDAARAYAFLHCDQGALHDPFLLEGMDTAVSRLRLAIERGETIAVYGDYDVDGITAVTLLYRALTALGAHCLWYIPDRMEEGYGLHTAAIESLWEQGARLLVTVDSGVTALEEAKRAAELGIELIITDHHECRETLPQAVAVLNPKIPGTRYPFASLAGVGVAFKLACALYGGTERMLDEYAYLVALGTVADVMPVLDENRYLVQRGLRQLGEAPGPGLKALLREASAQDRRITTHTIGFQLAPRLNAAGRMGRAHIAVELLLEDSPPKAQVLAQTICEMNRARQSMEGGIFEQVIGALELDEAGDPGPAIIMVGEDWHSGVVGIVASRLIERYRVPVFMICMDGGMGKGSARSVPGVHLVEALAANAALLDSYGGHTLAAGFSVSRENIPALKAGLLEYCRAVQPVCPESECVIDAEVRPEWLTLDGIHALSLLEPYGTGNPQPLFVLREATLREVTPIGQGKHTRLQLDYPCGALQAVWFHMDADSLLWGDGDSVDVVFRADINCFRAVENVQLLLVDMRSSRRQDTIDRIEWDKYCRLLRAPEALSAQEAAGILPERRELGIVWRRIEKLGVTLQDTPIELARQLAGAYDRRVGLGMVWVALEAFSYGGLIALDKGETRWQLKPLDSRRDKADIRSAPLLQALYSRARQV